ncbi:MAG TPA: ribonuclease HII, partial [Pelolinea sp.]|nr:ribonuclease HII [Pelolinea sp.]
MSRNKTHILPEKPDLRYEKQLWEKGFRVIAGLDEAGRGAWAGPVTAAAVVLPNDERVCQLLSGVRDSKQMTARQRQNWEGCIKSVSVAWAVACASEAEI